jgi:cytochrome c biogenesis protein CcmG, thiol:disulfide interchange protein DsbE
MRGLRWLIVPALVVPLGLLFLSGFGRDPSQIPSPLIGHPAPAWTLATLDGGSLSTDGLAGRAYVVNFWASWCGPCVDEHPVLASASTDHHDEVTIVGVLYQDTTADATAWLVEHGDAGYPNLVDDDGALAIDYGVTGPPESYFVDADGVVRAKQFGPLTAESMAEHLAEIGVGE